MLRPVDVDGGTLRAARVAVLDDSSDTALSIAAVFGALRISPIAFTDIESLVASSRGERFDAFVLDWAIKSGSAESVLRHLRAQPCYFDVPIFLLSGSVAMDGSPSDPALARAIGEHRLEFRVKPFSVLQLARQIVIATGRSSEWVHGGPARRLTASGKKPAP